VITQLSGAAGIALRDSSVNTFRMTVGDLAYIPAGTPHQITPTDESVCLRYMPLDAGLVGAAWYCPGCDVELHRYEWEHSNDLPAAGFYADACSRFNADLQARTCGTCGSTHPTIDLAAYGWKDEG
jgi:3-hydroxyanthranilate 3,4-dioxygenase